MKTLKCLFDNNLNWSQNLKETDPVFFLNLSKQQNPEYLWIGCSDSRVPANEIVGLMPGELFVHRNIANLVIHTDLNCLSVIQYAIDVLKVKHIIVCGHYGCGGILAALKNEDIGLATNWIRHIQDTISIHKDRLNKVADLTMKSRILCEINVVEQVYNIAKSSVFREASDKREIDLHGWIYGLDNGLLKDLNFCISNDHDKIDERRSEVIDDIFTKYNIVPNQI